jgi:pimeloyl-ACP methyl ester carboxylesterase
VRVFQVTTVQFLVVTGIVRELTPGVDFVAVASGSSVAIVPLKPLKEYSSYMAVLTNDINDTAGNDATPDQTYFFTKRRTPWVDANGKSTYPLIPDGTAQALEPLRQITQSMEGAAAAAGVNRDDIVLSWTVQTQSITPTLKLLRSIAAPMPVLAGPTGLTTAAVGGFGLANIVIGVVTLPYYSGIPSAANPVAPLTDFWKAPPGGYVPPFDKFGLDPTSTNVTIANPFPVLTGTQTVPFILTVPNANSQLTKPAGGWPVVIFVHGITRNRTDMLAIADALASVGYACIAIDQPLHGVVPDVAPQLAPFYVENTPFGPIANERTFDADFFNNTTGAFGPDGIKDASGASWFNLGNLRAVRDNLRQAQVDFSTLAVSLQNISYDGDAIADLNGLNVAAVAQSFGTFAATAFLAVEPTVSRGYYSAAGAVLLRTAEAGAFGVQIRAGLAARGVLPGTPQFEQFMLVGQTVLGSGDPASWAAEAAQRIPINHSQIKNDNTVPNGVSGSPMAGGEGLNGLMGLLSYSSSQANPAGLRAVARFLAPANHSSLLDPAAAPASTAEMQGQMASFIASLGTYVQVSNPGVLVPVAQEAIAAESEVAVAGVTTDTGMVVAGGSNLDGISIEPMSIVVQQGEAANE